MKILIFCATSEDEMLYEKYQMEGLQMCFEKDALNLENVKMVQGFDAIVVQTRCIIDYNMAEYLSKYGIKYCLTRSAGYDHMDINALKEFGIKAANVSLYSPNAIAEYVCMAALMLIRHAKEQGKMIVEGDYSLRGIRGRELRNMTIGIVGVGRIGFETLKIMHGFSNQILVYDVYQKEEAKQLAEYVPLEQLYQKSDLIIFHCPLLEENINMVNEDTIATMKDGVILINPARGGLWDYKAVDHNLENGKIAAAAFDVYDREKEFLRKKLQDTDLKDEVFQRLKNRQNVLYTAHSAFYTDTAIENMIQVTVENLHEYDTEKSCRNELIK